MSYTIQLLPEKAELDVIKVALRDFCDSSQNNEEAKDIAYGILAVIHTKEMRERQR